MFVFNLEKSRSNMQKHGIDFIQAQQIWDDPNCVERLARTADEKRFAVIGSIDGEIWTAIISYRDDLIRIISVRKARKHERQIYLSP